MAGIDACQLIITSILIWVLISWALTNNEPENMTNDDPDLESNSNNTFSDTIITAGLGPEIRRLAELETRLNDVQDAQILNTNVIAKLYKKDAMGDYIAPGWFVTTHDVISNPHGVALGTVLTRHYAVPRICFRAQNTFGFLGYPQNPTYLPKGNYVGFRAMTIYKIPKTGYYDFKVLSDDGSKLMCQIVDATAMQSQDNIYGDWTSLIDQWRFQAETWKYSKKIYFNQSDLVLLRMDYFNSEGNASACIKVRYTDAEEKESSGYEDLKFSDMYCSKVWSNIPIMNIE